MTVIITFAGVSGGDSLSDSIDVTNGATMSPGDSSLIQDLFIRHDAQIAPITNCAFYLTVFAGSGYNGLDADQDYEEIITWGTEIAGAGAKINQNVPDSWTTQSFFDETPGDTETFTNTLGTVDSPFELSEDAIIQGTAEDGKIYVGGEAHVQFKIDTPAVDDITNPAGYRAISLVFAYSATS